MLQSCSLDVVQRDQRPPISCKAAHIEAWEVFGPASLAPVEASSALGHKYVHHLLHPVHQIRPHCGSDSLSKHAGGHVTLLPDPTCLNDNAQVWVLVLALSVEKHSAVATP